MTNEYIMPGLALLAATAVSTKMPGADDRRCRAWSGSKAPIWRVNERLLAVSRNQVQRFGGTATSGSPHRAARTGGTGDHNRWAGWGTAPAVVGSVAGIMRGRRPVDGFSRMPAFIDAAHSRHPDEAATVAEFAELARAEGADPYRRESGCKGISPPSLLVMAMAAARC